MNPSIRQQPAEGEPSNATKSMAVSLLSENDFLKGVQSLEVSIDVSFHILPSY